MTASSASSLRMQTTLNTTTPSPQGAQAGVLDWPRPDRSDSETMYNTQSNFEAFKRTREEASDCCSPEPPRAAKTRRSCSFSSLTCVRTILESESEEEPPRHDDCGGKDLPHRRHTLFASWGDNAEDVVAAATFKSTPSITDVALETKLSDGPLQVSLLVNNLIANTVSATWTVGTLEPAMMEAVYTRIQKLLIHVQETGSMCLLPQALKINTSHIPRLNHLLLKLHRAALAKLHNRLPACHTMGFTPATL